ncbi:MAG: hypothetical protein QM534_04780 [Sediminibacterium sp.]|nr:hypothetical protein [Sediminibacterium sp.]
MKKVVLAIGVFITTLAVAQVPQVEKKWELSGFNNPESIIKDDANNVLYVSCVNGNPADKDNNGYISKVSVDGKVVSQKWIEGLHAPKGMAIYKGKLYIADINDIVVVDIVQAKITNRFAVEGSTFLNDIATDQKGNVYVSNTFGFSAIYKLSKNNTIETFLKDEQLQMPNGLCVDGDKLLIAPWGMGFDPATYQTKTPGSLLSVNMKSKKITVLSSPIGNLDGLEKTLHGYVITDWLAGKLFYYNGNTATELIDLPQGSADLEFDEKERIVYIPLMNDNKIEAYKLIK